MNPTNKKIKFGTDGWRAIIGEDFIPENCEKVIQAFCDVSLEKSRGKKVILGYDRRLHAQETAILACEVLAGNGFTVLLSDQYCPTPCISWMVKVSDAFAGIVITASHNPWQWNGIKFKEGYGGSASPAYTQEVEQKIIENDRAKIKIKKMSMALAEEKGLVKRFSPKQDYIKQLRSLLDVQAIQNSGFKILNDPLFGAGTHFIKDTLQIPVDEIHTAADPKFGGLNPEPIDKNLGELMSQMKTGKWDVGLATDGDADRIGAVDENGNFVNSHQIFALLLKHYVEHKKLKGTIIKSVSATQMIAILCKKYNIECIETPIGFKHICEKLVEHNALMGGEESGGLSFAPHVHERDGVLNALFLVEMMSVRQKKLGELIAELFAEIGFFYSDRVDLHLERAQIEALQAKLSATKMQTIAGKKITSINRLDGFKYLFEDNSWLLLRASGTEPLLRIYAEAASPDAVKKLLDAGTSLIC